MGTHPSVNTACIHIPLTEMFHAQHERAEVLRFSQTKTEWMRAAERGWEAEAESSIPWYLSCSKNSKTGTVEIWVVLLKDPASSPPRSPAQKDGGWRLANLCVYDRSRRPHNVRMWWILMTTERFPAIREKKKNVLKLPSLSSVVSLGLSVKRLFALYTCFCFLPKPAAMTWGNVTASTVHKKNENTTIVF